MKIVILGAGEIGTHLALGLVESGHSIVIIEADPSVAEELNDKVDARIIVGDGSDPNNLIEADVPGCDVFFALTSNNNINLVASTIAKHFQAQKTVCRIHQDLEAQTRIFDLKANFGVDEIFSSERLAAVELAKYIRNPDSDSGRVIEEIAGGFIELMEITVRDKAEVVGTVLRDLDLPERVRICAIQRGQSVIVPGALEKIKARDLLTVAGPHKTLGEIMKKFEPARKKKKLEEVIIFGGGDYGFALAQTLSSGGGNYRIRILESDLKLCDRLAHQLSNVTILNVDATSLSELKEEKVGEADFFVATTTRDEDNVMTCLQAHTEGAAHCLTLFHRADYANALMKYKDQMGILSAISPREATRKMLMRFVTDQFHLLRKLEGVELIEISVGEHSPAAGKKVREVKWPPNCILVGHWHASEARVPSADDVISAGDNVYAMLSRKSKQQFLALVS